MIFKRKNDLSKYNQYSKTAWNNESFKESKYCNNTYNWFSSDTEENYNNILKNDKNDYTPEDINYKMNSYGYRCDEFNNINYDYKILFAGCSITCGIGVKVEEVWGYKLIEKIRNTYKMNIPYWNIGMGAKSADYISRKISLAFDFIHPDIVIALFPEILRHELNYNNYISDFGVWNKKGPEFDVFTDEKNLYDYEKNLLFCYFCCKSYNTKFLWSSWDSKVHDNSFCELIQNCFLGTFFEHGPFPSTARDHMHPSKEYHEKFANNIFNKVIETSNIL